MGRPPPPQSSPWLEHMEGAHTTGGGAGGTFGESGDDGGDGGQGGLNGGGGGAGGEGGEGDGEGGRHMGTFAPTFEHVSGHISNT
eukprot:1012049-Prymnesium_polylepis.1